MVWLILLACWGLLSLIWGILGWFLPEERFFLVFRCASGAHPDGAISRYHWLRSLGLVRGQLLVIGQIPLQEQEIWKKKHPDVEFLTAEEIPSALNWSE